MKSTRSSWLVSLVAVFAFFTATGSFPVDIFGVKLSNAYSLAFFAVLPFFLPLYRRVPTAPGLASLAALIAFFAAWQACSALWAPDPAFSAYRSLVVSGYALLALLLPIVALAHSLELSALYARTAVFASVGLVASAWAFLPIGARAVFPQLFLPALALEPLLDYDLNDPNIIACALALGLICSLQSLKQGWRITAAIICCVAIVLTQSRTALLFLPVAALMAAALTRNGRALRNALLAILVLAAVGTLLFKLSGGADDLTALVDAFGERFFSDSASNEDRVLRLQGALQALQDPQVFLFGLGSGGSIASGLEPHNMFLSFFLELGLLGLAMFCGIFALVLGLAVSATRNDPRRRFFLLWSFFFIFFACLTYWHTRTLWFSLSMIVYGALATGQSAQQSRGHARSPERASREAAKPA